MKSFRVYFISKEGIRAENPLPGPMMDNPKDELKRLQDVYPGLRFEVDIEASEMSEVNDRLENLFDKLNEIYFDGKLPKPIITVQSAPQTYGHCSTRKIWVSDKDSRYEINIGAEYLNRPAANVAATMVHESVHLFCLEAGIDDTCQNGRYHNKNFLKQGTIRDLNLSYRRDNGYSTTEPTEALIEKLKAIGFDTDIKFARLAMAKPDKPKAPPAPRNKSNTYVCPVCGQTVKSTKELNIICGDCNEQFEIKQQPA